MAQMPTLGYEKHRLKTEYKDLVKQHPDARETIDEHNVLNDILSLTGCTPKKIDANMIWVHTVGQAKANRVGLCRVVKGKNLFGALYGVYSFTLSELKAMLQNNVAKRGFTFCFNIPR
jgi:hypothetical protein